MNKYTTNIENLKNWSCCFLNSNLDIPSFTFEESETGVLPLCKYEYVMICMTSWDRYWKDDVIKYLPRNLDHLPPYLEGSAHKGKQKVIQLQKLVQINKYINAPAFDETPPGANFVLMDGRHRIFLLRELGLSEFPAAVPSYLLEDMKKIGLIKVL